MAKSNKSNSENLPADNLEGFSDLDLQRSDETVRQLHATAKKLNFTGDVEHWAKLLKSRGIEPDG